MLLSDVCLSRTSGLTPEQKGLGRPNWHRGSPRHTSRTPLSRSKGQGHQAALLSMALMQDAGAAMTVRTYWAWETNVSKVK